MRAVARKTDSDKAVALAKAGAEVVEGNMDDAESLKRAFDGAHGVFLVTNFWEHFSPEKELAQATGMAKAAKAAGVRHALWSTLEDTRKFIALDDPRMPTLQGKYKVPHFDAKGEADAVFTHEQVPTTFVRTSFFWENFTGPGMAPQKGPDGKLAITLPMGDAKMPGIAVGDIGKCAVSLFERGDEFIGKTVGLAGDHPTGAQMAATLSKVLGKEIGYNYVPPEIFRAFGFPGADDLGNMFQFYRDFEKEFSGARDLGFARSLNPAMQDFATWAEANKDRFPVG